MASNIIDIEITNIRKIKEFLSETLILAEEIEVKLNQINKSQSNDITNEIVEKFEEVVKNLGGI